MKTKMFRISGCFIIIFSLIISCYSTTWKSINGWEFLTITIKPVDALLRFWPVYIGPLLYAFGLFILGSDVIKQRKLLSLMVWTIPYISYFVYQGYMGKVFLIQYFQFNQPLDIIYLYLISTLIIIVGIIVAQNQGLYDIYSLFFSLFLYFLIQIIMQTGGVWGYPENHMLQRFSFMVIIPTLATILISMFLIVINTVKEIIYQIRKEYP